MKFKFIYILALTFIITIGCSEFNDLNVDPNAATQVAPSTLLSRAQYRLFNRTHGRNLNAEWGMLMVQHWAQNEYTEESRYVVDENSFNTSWTVFYTEVLKELETAKELVEKENIPDAVKTNKKNIIEVTKVITYMTLTDGFGGVPYTEAINFEFDLPAYDSQETIYKGMLSTLENVANSFDENSLSFSSGELIYDGNIPKWKKFTRSLMLRLAMRIVDVDQNTASKYVTAASTDLISNASEEAKFVFQSIQDRANPLYRDVAENNRDDFCITELLVDALKDSNDPRLEKYAKKSSTGMYIGMPYGLSDNDATLLKNTTSRPNDDVRKATTPSTIVSHAEVQFLLAEAYQRGILNGNAANAYNEGIKASLNHWGITDTSIIDTYVASQAYDATNWKKSIGYQKWIALYTNGLEAWAEWRRLDQPELKAPAAAEESQIPTKLPYPNSEISNNSEQLKKITNTPKIITNKVWWDVN